ncbi:unnamed protein product, partial [Rotaria socialis]
STLSRARRLQTPRIPDSQIFDFPESYTITLKNQPFLCIDQIIKRKTRVLVFASNEPLKLLFNSSVILMGSTFTSSPSIFSQVYCIHAIKYEQSFVCVFALLPDKKKSTYNFLFHELRNKAAQLNMIFHPNTIMSDFEETLADVIKSDFSNSLHVGCYFHYTQAIYRKSQRPGLSSEYAADEEIRNACRKIMALALMPVSLVLQAFDDLSELVLESSTIKFNLLKPLFRYFENQWLKNVYIQRWNVYGLKLRTNNNCEGEENRFNHLLIQMKGGLQTQPKTKKTQAIQQRIDTLYIRRDNGDVTSKELLEGLSFIVAKNIKPKRK